MVIEELEGLKANGERNYDFLVLQATDNSIPFYESLGFVRVGGIMEEKLESDNKDEGDSPHPDSEIITSDTTTYVTKKRGEQPSEIARKLKLDVWDIIFLNKGLFADPITPTSKLLLGTTLQVPVTIKKVPRPPTRVNPRRATGSPCKSAPGSSSSVDTDNNSENSNNDDEDQEPEWYTAKENDTPTQLARKFKVSCQELIKANAARLPGLMGKSRLKAGTRVQVSHFHIETKAWTAYAHWSFPDEQMEDGEPSYMMCYKLNRQAGRNKATSATPVLDALEGEVQEYTPTPLLWPPTPEKAEVQDVKRKGSGIGKKAGRNLSTILEAAVSAPTITTGGTIGADAVAKQPDSLNAPILTARDTNRDALVQVNPNTVEERIKPTTTNDKSVPADSSSGSDDNDVVTGGSKHSDTKPSPTTALLELKPPKRPMSSFVLFCQDMRERKQHLLDGLSLVDASRVLADRWLKAPSNVKEQFEALAEKGKRVYSIEKEAYEGKLAALKKEQKAQLVEQEQQQQAQHQRRDSTASSQSDRSSLELVGVVETDPMKRKKQEHNELYNKIVKVKPEALPVTMTARPTKKSCGCDDSVIGDPTRDPDLQPDLYTYWFVLTYIPDLKWCHLVPLVQVGEFTADDKKQRLIGRPKWKLVDESLCQEIDISSRYVVPVKSGETKRSANADKEEWYILEQDDEDASSEEGRRSSSRKSTGGKRSRKRSQSTSAAQERLSKKRAYASPFGDQPTAQVGVTCKPNMPPSQSAGGHSRKEGPSPFGFTLPPMKIDIPSAKAKEAETNSSDDGSGSPSTPGSYPPCTCSGPEGYRHCPVHQGQSHDPHHHAHQYYYHPSYQHHPYPGHYYAPPHEYLDDHDGRPMHNHHRRPQPPPGWPRNAPFPPPAPYPPHHYHQQYHQHYYSSQERAPHHYEEHGYGHEQPYYPPSYADHPPRTSHTPCHRPSAAHLELSVEREVAL